MLNRERNYQSIAWIRDQDKAGNLDLDPPYQRKSVWSKGFQQFFVDSILRNYPVPAIFIAEEIESSSGKAIHHVIDGKQRLTAILHFLQNEFATGKESEPSLQKKYYSDLDPKTQRDFLSYRLAFEVFPVDGASERVIQDIYERFNKNVAKLNEQELRKAKYPGEFATKISDLADRLSEDKFWSNIGLFSKSQFRRLKDIEYVAELFVLTLDGPQEPDVLDEYYAKYDDDFPDYSVISKKFEDIKDKLEEIRLNYETTRFSNINDFYSLWAAVREFVQSKKKLDIDKTQKGLIEFSSDINSAAPSYKGTNKPSEDAIKYSDAVRQGANKKNNRQLRAELILKRFVFKK